MTTTPSDAVCVHCDEPFPHHRQVYPHYCRNERGRFPGWSPSVFTPSVAEQEPVGVAVAAQDAPSESLTSGRIPALSGLRRYCEAALANSGDPKDLLEKVLVEFDILSASHESLRNALEAVISEAAPIGIASVMVSSSTLNAAREALKGAQ
jgi:hypothetical protein